MEEGNAVQAFILTVFFYISGEAGIHSREFPSEETCLIARQMVIDQNALGPNRFMAFCIAK